MVSGRPGSAGHGPARPKAPARDPAARGRYCPPQAHSAPQAQLGPHWHPAFCAVALLFWHPQVQVVPGQVLQLQVMSWAHMVRSSRVGELPG